MKKFIPLIIIGVIVIIVIACIGAYNGLVDTQETVEQYKSDIDSNLQRRADLIPNLVATVKGYAAHEEEIFTEIANARAAILSAGTVQESADADAAMSSALSRLLAIAENYPDLKANQNFLDLQTQLEGTENRINIARTKYNEAVKSYNTDIRKFPKSIIAGMMGFDKADYFQASAGSDKVPDVSFD